MEEGECPGNPATPASHPSAYREQTRSEREARRLGPIFTVCFSALLLVYGLFKER